MSFDPPKNEVHHWWPRTVSKFWRDADGCAHQIDNAGNVVRSPPKSFGGVRNDNNITFKASPTVWDMSFEKVYAKADDGFSGLIEWLQTCTSAVPANEEAFPKRLTPVDAEDQRLDMLAECLASMIARSPSFRDRVSRASEYYRGLFGLPDPKPEKTLVAAGVRGAQESFSRALRLGGKYTLLQAGSEEFIFGDGFLHSFSGIDHPLHARCLIPLTPVLAVFYSRPTSYRSYPRVLTMNLRPNEVAFVNQTVQIYSQRYLFYRKQKPVLDAAFKQGVHLEFEYHQHPWIEQLQHAATNTYFAAPT